MNWTEVKTIQSTNEAVAKYVFSKGDAVAEAVLYRYPAYEKRTVICCSTQSGCPMGCRFCGAGDYFVRSLTADEIVEQPVRLLADTGVEASRIERLQIMFMSMGEPLLNLKSLIPAIESLYAAYPHAALLISTSAPRVDYRQVEDVSARIPTVGLQFSIHESTDSARDLLIPFKEKLTLKEIAHRGHCWWEATDRSPFFNYCAHEGNSTCEDADRLLELFHPEIWQATVSVICEREEHVAAANERQRHLAIGFESKLRDRGFLTRTFDPAGQDDIGGGCGQLWFVQDWMRQNVQFVRPSIGLRSGLPVIHTPRAIC